MILNYFLLTFVILWILAAISYVTFFERKFILRELNKVPWNKGVIKSVEIIPSRSNALNHEYYVRTENGRFQVSERTFNRLSEGQKIDYKVLADNMFTNGIFIKDVSPIFNNRG